VAERDRDPARQFYRKYLEVKGLPVVAAAEVSDQALERTHDIVSHMLAGRPDLVEAMVKNRMYLIIIARTKCIPTCRNTATVAIRNFKTSGCAGPADAPRVLARKTCSVCPSTGYDDEKHAVHDSATPSTAPCVPWNPTWNSRKEPGAYQHAVDKGLFRDTYAGSNAGEYWAEIAQAYFDYNRVNNWNHGPIGTPGTTQSLRSGRLRTGAHHLQPAPGTGLAVHLSAALPKVIPPPAKFRIDSFYTKFTWAREFPVLGRQASDAALLKANDTIRKLFAYRQRCVYKALMADGLKLVVLGRQESLAKLPEYAAMQSVPGLDPLARWLDYRPETQAARSWAKKMFWPIPAILMWATTR